MAILNGLKFTGLTEEEEDRINQKLDSQNPDAVTEKDLITEEEGQKYLKYFVFRQKVREVKDAIGSHFGGDEEQMKKFVRETLALHHDPILEKLTTEQIEKLSLTIKKAGDEMPF